MKKNMGMMDRIFRVGVAVVVGSLYLTTQLSGMIAAVLGLGAIILAVTGFAGICPIYSALNLSTRHKSVSAQKGVQ